MSNELATFTECYDETRHQFPGSSPDTLTNFAARLHKSLNISDYSCKNMTRKEFHNRCVNLGTSLQTVVQWPGWRPGDGRLANAEN